jgi:hypothetical protein
MKVLCSLRFVFFTVRYSQLYSFDLQDTALCAGLKDARFEVSWCSVGPCSLIIGSRLLWQVVINTIILHSTTSQEMIFKIEELLGWEQWWQNCVHSEQVGDTNKGCYMGPGTWFTWVSYSLNFQYRELVPVLPSGQKLTFSLLATITLQVVPFRVYAPFPALLPFF